MTKRTITKFWIAGAVAIAVAGILVIGNGVALLDHLAALPTGRGATADDFSRRAVALMILGGSIASIGLVAELVRGSAASPTPIGSLIGAGLSRCSGVAPPGS